MDEILKALLQSGPMGIIVAALLVWVWRLSGELKESEAARVADAKAFTERALLLQERIYQQVEKLQSVADALWRERKDGE